MSGLTDAVTVLAASVWLYPIVYVLAVLDGFFPPLPSETIVVAVAAISATTGNPNLWFLGISAILGAATGDTLAYLVGRTVGTSRWRWMRTPRSVRAFEWAGKTLRKKATLLIISARYVPLGRFVVNATAGATGFRLSRFITLIFVSCTMWAAYLIALGTLAGNLFHEQPLLAAIVGGCLALLLGLVVDLFVRANKRFTSKRRAAEDVQSVAESFEGSLHRRK